MHEREGSPCQDRVACQTTSDANGEAVLLAVVSDGAGSAERAEVGSDLACATLMDISSDFIKMGRVEEIDANVAISWFETVRQVLAERAQADGEAESATTPVRCLLHLLVETLLRSCKFGMARLSLLERVIMNGPGSFGRNTANLPTVPSL